MAGAGVSTTRSTGGTERDLTGLVARLHDLGEGAGLAALGIASAEPFDHARRVLEERKARGLHGGMAFTYRNPARSTDPQRSLEGARALVVGAYGYRRRPPERAAAAGPASSGVVARYSWEDHYEPLRSALRTIADALVEEGFRAEVVADDNALVDRAAAHRAGLGWYGKNANLLLPGHGSWFVLGSVITDAPLPPSTAAPMTTEEGCGTCTRCLPACPTGALVAPGVLDARRCLAWLVEAHGVFPREHRIALGARIYGCDDCQEACPPNRTEERRVEAPVAGPGAEPTVDLVALLAMDDDELLAHFGRWYIAGRDPAHLRRNALIALANAGDPHDPPVRAAVEVAARDPRAVVRAHAVWAAARLGFDDVVSDVRLREQDPLVLDELGELPDPRTR